MTYSHLDPAMHNRVAWNAGKTVGTKRPLTQKQIWAIRFFLDREERLTAIGLRREDYGTHSMRRTKAAMIYRATGNLRAVQILLGHSKIENTVRYLGVDVEDALILAERTEI